VVPAGADSLDDGSTALLPVLVITAAHSRFITARMIPTRKTEDLLPGPRELIAQLGRVPRRLIWDDESGIGTGGGWRKAKPVRQPLAMDDACGRVRSDAGGPRMAIPECQPCMHHGGPHVRPLTKLPRARPDPGAPLGEQGRKASSGRCS
jgi:hypothetical protein